MTWKIEIGKDTPFLDPVKDNISTVMSVLIGGTGYEMRFTKDKTGVYHEGSEPLLVGHVEDNVEEEQVPANGPIERKEPEYIEDQDTIVQYQPEVDTPYSEVLEKQTRVYNKIAFTTLTIAAIAVIILRTM